MFIPIVFCLHIMLICLGSFTGEQLTHGCIRSCRSPLFKAAAVGLRLEHLIRSMLAGSDALRRSLQNTTNVLSWVYRSASCCIHHVRGVSCTLERRKDCDPVRADTCCCLYPCAVSCPQCTYSCAGHTPVLASHPPASTAAPTSRTSQWDSSQSREPSRTQTAATQPTGQTTTS